MTCSFYLGFTSFHVCSVTAFEAAISALVVQNLRTLESFGCILTFSRPFSCSDRRPSRATTTTSFMVDFLQRRSETDSPDRLWILASHRQPKHTAQSSERKCERNNAPFLFSTLLATSMVMALCHNLSRFRSLQIHSCFLSQSKINCVARLIFGADDASASDFLKDGCDGYEVRFGHFVGLVGRVVASSRWSSTVYVA